MEFKYAVMIGLLLVVPMAYAGPGNLTTELLSKAMEQVTCKTDFSVGLVNDITANVPSAGSLSSYATKLQADESQLQTYASSGDMTNFRSYVHATYDPDLVSLNSAIRSWRTDSGRNSTNATTRATLRSDEQQLRTTLESCHVDALRGYADAKISWYNDILSQASTNANTLSSKGIDTSALTSLISDAQSQIVTPLQSAVSSATDSKSLLAALDQYCLYDGCKTGTNFHFAAKWDIAKLNAVESKVQAQNSSGNYSSQLSTVTSDLNTANSALSTVGSSEYGPGQSDAVWNPIKDAADVLKQIIHGMRS